VSTILNALRRLEEDASAGETQSSDSRQTTDPRSTDELRSRILKEEKAAAARAEQHNRSLIGRPLPRALAAGAVLLGAISLGVFGIAPRVPSIDSSISSITEPPALTAASPIQQPQNIAPENPPPVANRPARRDPPTPTAPSMLGGQPSKEPRIAAAAVNRTPAKREATGVIETASASASATAIAPGPPSRSSVQTSPAQPTLPDSRRETIEVANDRAPTPPRKTQSRPTPSPDLGTTASVAAPPIPARASEPSVEQHIAPPTPDIAVLQTAWHPKPDHRSARIRLLKDDETLTLREGDAVGPLVVQQITPSAVIFLSGDVELRLRVGRPGLGD
jgi:hypothetical protein